MRLSVTELESYRRYRDIEEVSLDDLLRQLRRQSAPSRPMLAGSAFHKVLENADLSTLEVVEQDGFKFRFALDCEITLPVVRELKGEMVLPSPVGPVTLVGIVDGLDQAIRDYKLSARFDAERYADSYQWRCYLEMFKGHKFTYDVFVGKDGGEDGEWLVYDYHQLPLYRYPGMSKDVQREINEFAVFVSQHLPERLPITHKEAA